MSRGRDRDLERRLHELRAPDEAETEERSLEVVRAAYAAHAPMRPSRGARRIALGVGCGAVALAIGLSPAGAKVGDLVHDVFSPEQAGEPNAKPALRSLPAPGQLLVQTPQGPWVVRADGSKRLLGEYRDAVFSPHGRYVAAVDGRVLTALEPDGTVRWTVTAAGPVSDPRWSPCCDEPFIDYRIAYRTGSELRVVDADGSDDRLVADRVAPLPPAWRSGVHGHVLTYVDRFKRTHTVDVDTGASRSVRPGDVNPLLAAAAEGRAISPDGSTLATIESDHGRERLVVQRRHSDVVRVLFAAPGKLTGPTWSPDGHWLLIGWPAADQWLFIPVGGADHGNDEPIPFGRIAQQFAPGTTAPAAFPRVLAWAPEPPSD
jgi:hypothetical protein